MNYTLTYKCNCDQDHTIWDVYPKTSERPSFLARHWPWSEFNTSGRVISWNTENLETCRALIRTDGKIFGKPDCSHNPNLNKNCLKTARIVDGYLRGYSDMYFWV